MPTGRPRSRSARLPGDWRTRRARVLTRDAHTCRLAYDICTMHATQVDHIAPGDDHRYSNLQAVCRPCHERKTVTYDTPRRTRPAVSHPGLVEHLE